MDALYRRAIDLLEIACSPGASIGNQWIACDDRYRVTQLFTLRHGWSLPGLAAETGAAAVFRVERWPGKALVEAWSRGATCSVCRELPFKAGADCLPQAFLSPAHAATAICLRRLN